LPPCWSMENSTVPGCGSDFRQIALYSLINFPCFCCISKFSRVCWFFAKSTRPCVSKSRRCRRPPSFSFLPESSMIGGKIFAYQSRRVSQPPSLPFCRNGASRPIGAVCIRGGLNTIAKSSVSWRITGNRVILFYSRFLINLLTI